MKTQDSLSVMLPSTLSIKSTTLGKGDKYIYSRSHSKNAKENPPPGQ